MKVTLIPQRVESEEWLRIKLEQSMQHCVDRLEGGGDPDICGVVLRTCGTSWIERSLENDIRIFS